jgi:hypothetical protein
VPHVFIVTFATHCHINICIANQSVKTYPILLLKVVIFPAALASAAKVFYRARADVESGLFDRASRF